MSQNLFNQSYAFSDTEYQAELLRVTLSAMGQTPAQIDRAVAKMIKRVRKFYFGTSKYDGNGKLKNVAS